MRHHKIRPAALAELDEAASWYEQERQGLGMELLAEYRARLNEALLVPNAGTIATTTKKGTVVRRFHLKRFDRYSIVIAGIDGVPTVLAFEHSSRRPKYWRGRIR